MFVIKVTSQGAGQQSINDVTWGATLSKPNGGGNLNPQALAE